MSEPWERQDKETESSYIAFVKYRDMKEPRSLDSLVQSDTEGVPTIAQVKRLSVKFGWVKRCLHWDRHIQLHRDLVAAAEAAKWERRRLLACERNWDLATKLDDKIEKMLAFPLATEKVGKDGKKYIMPAKWNLATVTLMIKTLQDLRASSLTAMTKPMAEYNELELRAIRDASPAGPGNASTSTSGVKD